MLRRLEIRSFKSYRALNVELDPISVVVGANGAGKTTLLQAIEFLTSLVRGTIDDEFALRSWTYLDLVNKFSPGSTFGLTAHLDLDGEQLVWSVDLHKRRGSYIASEAVVADGETILRRTGRRMERLDRSTDGTWESVQQSLPSSWLATVDDADDNRFPQLLKIARWARGAGSYVELSPAVLRRPSRKTATGIGSNGESLAGFLRYLADNRPDAYSALIANLKKHYRHLDRIVIRSPRAGWNRLELVERWGSDRVAISSEQVSDGFLRLCAVAAMSFSEPAPTILMMDEVENGVHPRLLGSLMTLLTDVAQRGTQVLVTTHSPIALNSIDDPHSVLVTRRTAGGNSRVTPLSETAGYEALHRVFRPGEMWVALGEDDLIKRPRATTPRP